MELTTADFYDTSLIETLTECKLSDSNAVEVTVDNVKQFQYPRIKNICFEINLKPDEVSSQLVVAYRDENQNLKFNYISHGFANYLAPQLKASIHWSKWVEPVQKSQPYDDCKNEVSIFFGKCWHSREYCRTTFQVILPANSSVATVIFDNEDVQCHHVALRPRDGVRGKDRDNLANMNKLPRQMMQLSLNDIPNKDFFLMNRTTVPTQASAAMIRYETNLALQEHDDIYMSLVKMTRIDAAQYFDKTVPQWLSGTLHDPTPYPKFGVSYYNTKGKI